MNSMNRKHINITGKVCALLTSALVIAACGGSSGGGGDDDVQVAGKGKGPRFSIEAEAFCGNPAMVPVYDEYGAVTGYEPGVTKNVAVRLTDVSDDNGPEGAAIGNLTIVCTAAVKDGRGKPNDEIFAIIDIQDPGFGVIQANCPLGELADGATEWKASASAWGGDVLREVSDKCEEVGVQ